MIVRIDARTGKLYMYNTEGNPVLTLKPEPDTRIHVTPEEALANAELPEGISSDIPYQETLLIHSTLTGKIQPAHLYTQGDWQLYINAVNGKPDVPR
jgi:hypothetical protein